MMIIVVITMTGVITVIMARRKPQAVSQKGFPQPSRSEYNILAYK